KNSSKLILKKDDYKLLISILNGLQGKTKFDRKNAEDLKSELNNAVITSSDNFPANVVGMNSKVTIREEDKNEVMELVIVSPDKANIKKKKISVLAPIGTALIGFRQGQKVHWKVPAGNRTFT